MHLLPLLTQVPRSQMKALMGQLLPRSPQSQFRHRRAVLEAVAVDVVALVVVDEAVEDHVHRLRVLALWVQHEVYPADHRRLELPVRARDWVPHAFGGGLEEAAADVEVLLRALEARVPRAQIRVTRNCAFVRFALLRILPFSARLAKVLLFLRLILAQSIKQT